MYYQFHRLQHQQKFTGWALTWGGKVIETSAALYKFLNGPVEDLIRFCEDNNITWIVEEKKP